MGGWGDGGMLFCQHRNTATPLSPLLILILILIAPPFSERRLQPLFATFPNQRIHPPPAVNLRRRKSGSFVALATRTPGTLRVASPP